MSKDPPSSESEEAAVGRDLQVLVLQLHCPDLDLLFTVLRSACFLFCHWFLVGKKRI